MIKLPKRLAHRGASALAPENTLAALGLAADLGATWVEFDVALTADNEVVVIHDATVNRTTDGVGRVRQLTLKQLSRLDAGSWFAPDYAGEKVPTLREWLQLALARGLNLNIECKCAPKDAALLVSLVKQCLEQVHFLRYQQVLLSSGVRACVEQCQQQLPNLARGYIARRWCGAVKDFAQKTGCVSVNLDWHTVTAGDVVQIHKLGLKLLVWTVNAAQRIESLYNLGVDGVFSDVVVAPIEGESYVKKNH